MNLVTAPAATATLLELSESFGGLLAGLSDELGISINRVASVEEWLRTDAPVRAITCGGDEAAALNLFQTHPQRTRNVAVIGAKPDHHLAIAFIRAGAAQYFVLPQDLEHVRGWLREAIDQVEQAAQRRTFAAREEATYRFDGMVGASPALRQALSVAARVIARPSFTVLITGETGTGKELLARAIHYSGPRQDNPFVDVNCAAIPEQLLESELFGHEKGAITDAMASKPGLFEVANGGTIFLDEIGHLPLGLQGKLLRALEQRTIRRLGGTNTISVDVRVIAATHVDLPRAVQRGDFREDLYHRLNVVPIDLPPLRDRETDVVLLADHFLERLATDYDLPIPTLSSDARTRLADYRWPGNVRELRNVIERTLVLLRQDTITAADLAFRPTKSEPAGPADRDGTLREMIRAAATSMVARCGGNKSEAARRLAISRTRLLRLLDQHSTEDDPR